MTESSSSVDTYFNWKHTSKNILTLWGHSQKLQVMVNLWCLQIHVIHISLEILPGQTLRHALILQWKYKWQRQSFKWEICNQMLKVFIYKYVCLIIEGLMMLPVKALVLKEGGEGD